MNQKWACGRGVVRQAGGRAAGSGRACSDGWTMSRGWIRTLFQIWINSITGDLWDLLVVRESRHVGRGLRTVAGWLPAPCDVYLINIFQNIPLYLQSQVVIESHSAVALPIPALLPVPPALLAFLDPFAVLLPSSPFWSSMTAVCCSFFIWSDFASRTQFTLSPSLLLRCLRHHRRAPPAYPWAGRAD